MFRRTRWSKIPCRKVLLLTWIAALVMSLLMPTAALAWKPTTHMYLADLALEDALDDGLVTIYRVDYEGGTVLGEVGRYRVDDAILAALRNNPAQYRAGVLGPDAYPDILTGQQVIHPSPDYTKIPGGTDAWLQHLWDRSTESPNNTDAVKAFTIGYLTHAAGDMYGHTFVNQFSGGEFAIEPPEGPANAIKHIVLEGYVDKRLDQSAFDEDFFDARIDGVEDFIYVNMVDARPGTTLDDVLLPQNSSTAFSVPRIYSTLRAELVEDISRLREAADDCAWYDPTCSAIILNLMADYEEAWRDDIDSGLRSWPAISHKVALALFFNPDRTANTEAAEDILQDYIEDHLLSMSGLPDFVGLTAGIIRDIVNAITPDFLLEPIEQLEDALLDILLKEAIGMTQQELKDYLTSPEQYFDPIMTRGAGENVTLQRFNKQYLRINDSGYTNPAEAFDYSNVPAAYNTVTLSKLILLDPSEVNRLLSDLGSGAELTTQNVMLGFIRTLDGDNQWTATAAEQNGMVFAKDCTAYAQIFMRQAGEEPLAPDCVDADGDSLSNINEDRNGDNDLTNDDTDQDGTPDYLDADDDGDTIPTRLERSTGNDDTDQDGTPDYLDTDDDGDSIPTQVEHSAASTDPDGDKVPNYLDLNADGDPLSDAVEAGSDPSNPQDTDGDGTPDYLSVISYPGSIAAGWHLFSLPATPFNPDPARVLGTDTVTPSVLLSFEQGALTYDPNLPQFSTLHSVDGEHGYWLYTPNDGFLAITGDPLALNTPIALEQGWNLVSYLPQTPLPVSDALASIAGKYDKVLGYDNGAASYDLGAPLPLNTLQVMERGKGYWIHMREPGTLDYSQATTPVTSAAVQPVNQPQQTKDVAYTEGVVATNQWLNVYSTNSTYNGQLLAVGTIITAVGEDGRSLGQVRVHEPGRYGLLAVYGDSSHTDVLDGARPGERIQFRVNGQMATIVNGAELTWTANGDLFQVDLVATAPEMNYRLYLPVVEQ